MESREYKPYPDLLKTKSVGDGIKVLIVTGGAYSGIGKGVLTALLARAYISRGENVTVIKCDPYLNDSAGDMSPGEHGEVYMLSDGGEADLDFGWYERLGGVVGLTAAHNVTTGKAWRRMQSDIGGKQAAGKTLQFNPHLSNSIIACMLDAIKMTKPKPTLLIVEVGGTVGDDEQPSFLHALKSFPLHIPCASFDYVHFVPVMDIGHEPKTKAAQLSVKMHWATPTMIVGRLMQPWMSEESGVDLNRVKEALKVNSPLSLVALMPTVSRIEFLHDWANNVATCLSERNATFLSEYVPIIPKHVVSKMLPLALVGKYKHKDAYASIREGLYAIGLPCSIVQVSEIDDLNKYSGVVVAGGFGSRGLIHKRKAVKCSLEAKKPLLCICYGFQALAMELTAMHSEGLHRDCTEENMTAKEQEENGFLQPVVRFMDDVSHSMLRGAHPIFNGEEIIGTRRFRNRLGVLYSDVKLMNKFDITATSSYDFAGKKWIAELRSPNVLACQFHPEFGCVDELKSLQTFVDEILK